MSKKIALAIWSLALLLSIVILFTLNRGMTATFWITFAFVLVAFFSTLFFQCVLSKGTKTPDEGFLLLPSALISGTYVTIQIPLCVVFALCSGVIPWKAALLIHAIILILALVLMLSGLAGNNHIRNVNSRQKTHHTEL